MGMINLFEHDDSDESPIGIGSRISKNKSEEKMEEIQTKPEITTAIITKNDILSVMTYWAIRQSPYNFPLNLESALTSLSKKIDELEIFKSPKKKTPGAYRKMDVEEISALIKFLVFEIPEIAIWNVTKLEQDNGITDPNDEKRTIKYSFVSATGSNTSEDRDFIDLDALRGNVTQMLLNI